MLEAMIDLGGILLKDNDTILTKPKRYHWRQSRRKTISNKDEFRFT